MLSIGKSWMKVVNKFGIWIANGRPKNASIPVDDTQIENYPSLFNATTKSYGHMIIYTFLKPQMMLYGAFLTLFKA